jgi:pyridinium-3,5-biscarboxylic acid mononucleotide sulfurtransferase
MTADAQLGGLIHWLSCVPQRMIACSGGVDSMLLATVAHRASPTGTTVIHDVTPAVPAAATARVLEHADERGWTLRLVASSEFTDEQYLSNPRDRCYFCKSHLYGAMSRVVPAVRVDDGATLLSGANTDDLKEYRPGLRAADEHGVRHPYVELDIAKSDIRRLARGLGLEFADLPASPCLASRLYTGTRVTENRLRAVEIGEDLLRRHTGLDVVRCRVDESTVRVEVSPEEAARVTRRVLEAVLRGMQLMEPQLDRIEADPRGYRPGRAFELKVRT